MIERCTLYRHGKVAEERMSFVESVEAAREASAWSWIRIVGPTSDDVAALRREIEPHPLALEDALHRHHRPKLEVYGDTVFAVVKEAMWSGGRRRAQFDEVHLFVAGDTFVSIEAGARTQGTLSPVERAIAMVAADPELAKHGPGAALYCVLDASVDGYQPIIDHLEETIDDVESEVFSDRRSNAAERIYRVKQEAMALRRATQPLLDAIALISRGRVPYSCVPTEMLPFFRDVEGHLQRIMTRIDDCRELLSSALDVNLAKIGVRQNEDMRRMSAWAAMIAVPTMFAGIWGMNFQHMPELALKWGYPLALAVMLTASGLLYRRLRKSGWL